MAYEPEQVHVDFGDNMYNMKLLATNGNSFFVLYTTYERAEATSEAHSPEADELYSKQHIGWMRADGTALQTLRTLTFESVYDGYDADGQRFDRLHMESLGQVAQRPGGGMAVLIVEEEIYIDNNTGETDLKIETHLILYGEDGTIEREMRISEQFPEEEIPPILLGNSMQELLDGRIVISDAGQVFVFTPSGEIERIFEVALDSFVILNDGRMIATLFDLESWEWSTRYFNLETGQIIASNEDVVPAAYRSPGMIPGVQYDLYSPVGDYIFGIDLDRGKAEILFNWEEVSAHFQSFAVSETGAFYFFEQMGEEGEDAKEFRLIHAEAPQ